MEVFLYKCAVCVCVGVFAATAAFRAPVGPDTPATSSTAVKKSTGDFKILSYNVVITAVK